MKLLEDEETLDDEVVNGLIKSLKIPLPSLQNPPSQKEILFPARLIILLVKQMWKFGYIEESRKLFANVMKNIQEHVMVIYSNSFSNNNKMFLDVRMHC